MFLKGSRYKDLPDFHFEDEDSFAEISKSLRWIPETPGNLKHSVNQSDRLDLLAYKYYGDPERWWLICDANPDFQVPTDLLNQSPIMNEEFEIQSDDNTNELPKLIRCLEENTGIRKVIPGYLNKLVLIQDSNDDNQKLITINNERFKLEKRITLRIEYNGNETNQIRIKTIIEGKRYKVESIDKITRVGEKIIIPPNKFT